MSYGTILYSCVDIVIPLKFKVHNISSHLI